MKGICSQYGNSCSPFLNSNVLSKNHSLKELIYIMYQIQLELHVRHLLVTYVPHR